MILRTDPFRELDRWLDTAMRQVPAASPVPMDLYRQGDRFVARIDLPGVRPESIDVDVEDRTLTIRAERATMADEDVQWLSRERPVGTFARQLTLGQHVDVEGVDAAYSDGVLTLTLPLAEEARPRKIAVAREESHRTIEQGGHRTIEQEPSGASS
ncbi:Hsp20/alpha crystallin family protein [Georgenia sp. SUBG003]|uniref:Hsp20/alpha crystallin family protein n=1 Tax=Georgenia sp. SUBG003 TaxID=1497974 RepID=UPI0005B93CCF